MKISGGNIVKEEKKSSIGAKIILVSIILLIIIIIGMVGFLFYIQNNILRVYIDGVQVALEDDIIIIEENTGKIYVDIKGIAKQLGYIPHNGEFKSFSEDSNKCYVENDKETASFFLNSNKIAKVAPDQSLDYEDYTIADAVISKNGKLYCTKEGIEVGFNVSFDYKEDKKNITIFTLPYLVQYYESVMKGYGYTGVATEFENQKAILYDLFVVKREGGLYGVVNSQNKEMVSSKYSTMKFNESQKEFFVMSTIGKVGIVDTNANIKINLIYDEVGMLDKETGLYLVRSGNKTGVVDKKGSIVIHLEYSSIGIDTSRFSTTNIKNKYLLFDNAIPVCQNNKWGLFNIKGQMIVPVEYDVMGCTDSKTANSVIIIPNYKAIIMGKKQENKEKSIQYAIFSYEGVKLADPVIDSIYSVISGGVETYYMEVQNNKINVEDYLKMVYEKLEGASPVPIEENLSGDMNTNATDNNNITTNTTNSNLFNGDTNNRTNAM